MYGYDAINFNGGQFNSFDENYYLEMSKPPTKIESFDNVINHLMTTEDNNATNDYIKSKYMEGININRYLNSSCHNLKEKSTLVPTGDEVYFIWKNGKWIMPNK